MGREDKRERIFRGMEDLSLNKRYDCVTLVEVCRKAGVSRGAIYRHFEGKDDRFAQTELHRRTSCGGRHRGEGIKA